MFRAFGGLILTDTAGGRDELRELAHPALHDIVDQLSPVDSSPARSLAWHGTHVGTPVDALTTTTRVHDAAGRLAGIGLMSQARRHVTR